MDINDLRGLLTAIILLAFIGLCIWAWSSRRKADFDASAALPLEEDQYMTNNEQENI
ncbi:MAG: cbb3-type cytochrome c oxidase subunit 3 [Gammaproteobacteria bacterium]|jgi:cytochrome c oxidase cbb3-type subunit 4|nr:cbb3-type cytochrome c oxidase subunit 3 [Gammaproteobacteria bacterium]MDH3751978.1 cbb3-type cytochrome c oxidase subunit 3 [Gammaproteobacteria bacterium]MDH3805810.1 cbb3-type cytochrome c oxidase subunit 3 [Gammaproteobacteria bacterium]